MATDNRRFGVSLRGMSVKLNHDVWHLVLDQIDSRRDLCNVCLTSRSLFAMAIPHLYKVVPLTYHPKSKTLQFARDPKWDPLHLPRALSSRLLDSKHKQVRNAVQELDFGWFNDEHLGGMEAQLVALVDSLPNLRRVKIRGPLSQDVFEKLTENSKHISLHLLYEDGTRRVERDLQNVTALAVRLSVTDEREGPNRHILSTQALFFACPNMTSLALDVVRDYGGCVISMPSFDIIDSFQFAGDEVFPPLAELSLSGYWFDEAEWAHWRGKLQWSRLRSLALGPQQTSSFLKLAAGYATSLRDLTITVHTDEDRETDCPPLELFLTTFTSLESLTVKGYHLPIGPIGNHPGLKHLCLHAFEPIRGETPRQTLSIEQLQKLDECCAHLETLEIDLCRDGEWVSGIRPPRQGDSTNTAPPQPEDLLKILATGFRNLQSLTLHLELGLRNLEGRRAPDPENSAHIKPMLTEDSAKEVGRNFFKWRSSARLNKLVLMTGESLRRYPQWEPGFSVFERKNTYTMVLHRPRNMGGVPKVEVMVKPSRHFY
ncbi:hypothetical protein F4802DRAFT_596232 [Xylaria palmicola]|nr:hypothetical protein F4802DRAFT_596232 [Xylaria palmicola]